VLSLDWDRTARVTPAQTARDLRPPVGTAVSDQAFRPRPRKPGLELSQLVTTAWREPLVERRQMSALRVQRAPHPPVRSRNIASVGVPYPFPFVARISEAQSGGGVRASNSSPDFASLHPGYQHYQHNSGASALRERGNLSRKPTRGEPSAFESYWDRFNAETARMRLYYCNVFALWQTCRSKPCRRARGCQGDPRVCLQRGLAQIPRELQWRARQGLLQVTPSNAGAVVRAARDCMPADLACCPDNAARPTEEGR
jgi:hypothetical protein